MDVAAAENSKAPNGAPATTPGAKAPVVTTTKATGAAGLPVEPLTPATPNPSAAGNEPDSNPYMEVVYKKLRALKKRLSKLTSYEDAQKQGKTLDSDQKQSLQRKGEVELLIKEYEDMEKQLKEVETEVQKAEKKALKKKQADDKKLAQLAKEKEDEQLRQALEIHYLVKQFGDAYIRNGFIDGTHTRHPLTEAEVKLLDTLGEAISPAYDKSIGLHQLTQIIQHHFLKLQSESEDSFQGLATYNQITKIFQSLLNSRFFNLEVAQAEIKAAEEARIAAELAAKKAAEEAQRLAELVATFIIVDKADLPHADDKAPEQINGTLAPPISFLNDSELEIEEPKVVVAPVVKSASAPAAPAATTTAAVAPVVNGHVHSPDGDNNTDDDGFQAKGGIRRPRGSNGPSRGRGASNGDGGSRRGGQEGGRAPKMPTTPKESSDGQVGGEAKPSPRGGRGGSNSSSSSGVSRGGAQSGRGGRGGAAGKPAAATAASL